MNYQWKSMYQYYNYYKVNQRSKFLYIILISQLSNFTQSLMLLNSSAKVLNHKHANECSGKLSYHEFTLFLNHITSHNKKLELHASLPSVEVLLNINNNLGHTFHRFTAIRHTWVSKESGSQIGLQFIMVRIRWNNQVSFSKT